MSHRNEPARERRRKTLKQDQSLSSLPLDDKKRRQLTLENHFGWTVLQKCQVGDGNIPRYPQVVQYHEKPDLYGPDYQKVTHVLYLKGREDSLGKSVQETQTSMRNVNLAGKITVVDVPSPHIMVKEEKEEIQPLLKTEKPHKEEKHKKKEKHEKHENHVKIEEPRDDSPGHPRKKLITNYYYKKRDRSVSSERIFRPIDSVEAYNLPEENPVVVENYTTDYVPPANKKPKTEKGRSTPKSWQLRAEAGAETYSDDFIIHFIGEGGESDDNLEQESKLEGETKFVYRSRYERPYGEVLWDPPTRTNEYLYISERQEENADELKPKEPIDYF